MKKNIGRILVGLLLIAMAVLAVMGSFNIGFTMPGDVQIWQWVVGILLLFPMLDGLRRLEFAGFFLLLGFEFMVFEPQIGSILGFAERDWISNWLVFFVSLLLGIGFSMIVKGCRLFNFKIKKNTLAHTVKYIDCADFEKETVSNKMGELDVRFENVCALSRNTFLTVHNSLGETRVYVPSEWKVKVNMVNTLGDVTVDNVFKEKKERTFTAEGETEEAREYTLTVKAYNKLGEIKIIAH